MRKHTDRSSAGDTTTGDFPIRDGLELLIPQSAWEHIQNEMVNAQSHEQETGGILIGARSKTNEIYVAEATGPGPNASHHRAEFSPDVEYSQKQLDTAREELDVFWIGTWHKHPGDMISPSNGDISQMQGLVRDPDTLDEVVSVILTEQAGSVKARAYHMDTSLEPHYLPIKIIPDDAPIQKEFEWDPDPIETTDRQDPAAEDSNETDRQQKPEEPSEDDHSSRDGVTETEESNSSRSEWGGTYFGHATSVTEEGSRDIDIPVVVPPKLDTVADSESDGSSDQASDTESDDEIDFTTLNTDRSLRGPSGELKAEHIPRTATEWAVLAAGTRALNNLQRPGYEPKRFKPDRDEARATIHEGGRVSFTLNDGTVVELSDEADREVPQKPDEGFGSTETDNAGSNQPDSTSRRTPNGGVQFGGVVKRIRRFIDRIIDQGQSKSDEADQRDSKT